MSRPIETLADLQAYIRGVCSRAEHHGKCITKVLPFLLLAVVMAKDPGTAVEVRTQEGELKNELWVTIHGTRYQFTYDHANKAVRVRRGGNRGEVVGLFSNRDDISAVEGVFGSL